MAAVAHFGCCVLCVVCCVFCVVCCVLCVVVVMSPFCYLTGRNVKIGPAKKMADLSALITKNASLDAPNVKGCPKSSLSLVFGHVLRSGSAEKVCST